ncbi:MAG: hypothetical protein QM770_08595 [Tepidisphaeraceae bacterium]
MNFSDLLILASHYGQSVAATPAPALAVAVTDDRPESVAKEILN